MKKLLSIGLVLLVAFALVVSCADKPKDTKIEVSFDLNYDGAGDNPAAVKIKKNTALGDALPADPSRSGWKFEGWFTAATGGAQVTGVTPIAAKQTLYAQWSQPVVSFNTQGGTAVESKTVAVGSLLKDALPTAAATRTANSTMTYKFLGWFTAASGGTKIEATSTITVTGNRVVYAQWEKTEDLTKAKNSKGDAFTPAGIRVALENNAHVAFAFTLPTKPTYKLAADGETWEVDNAAYQRKVSDYAFASVDYAFDEENFGKQIRNKRIYGSYSVGAAKDIAATDDAPANTLYGDFRQDPNGVWAARFAASGEYDVNKNGPYIFGATSGSWFDDYEEQLGITAAFDWATVEYKLDGTGAGGDLSDKVNPLKEGYVPSTINANTYIFAFGLPANGQIASDGPETAIVQWMNNVILVGPYAQLDKDKDSRYDATDIVVGVADFMATVDTSATKLKDENGDPMENNGGVVFAAYIDPIVMSWGSLDPEEQYFVPEVPAEPEPEVTPTKTVTLTDAADLGLTVIGGGVPNTATGASQAMAGKVYTLKSDGTGDVAASSFSSVGFSINPVAEKLKEGDDQFTITDYTTVEVTLKATKFDALTMVPLNTKVNNAMGTDKPGKVGSAVASSYVTLKTLNEEVTIVYETKTPDFINIAYQFNCWAGDDGFGKTETTFEASVEIVSIKLVP